MTPVSPPQKDRSKTWIIVAVVAVVFLIGTLVTRSVSQEESVFNNIIVFALVNVNVMALLVLIFMVGRNVMKLIFERRSGILGSKLRSRLVSAFVLIAFIPMTVSFLVASGLINEAMDGWFSTQIDTAVTGAVTIARQHLTTMKIYVRGATSRAQRALEGHGDLSTRSAALQEILDDIRHANDLYSVRLMSTDGGLIIESSHATAGVDAFKEPRLDSEAIRKVKGPEQIVRIEERGASQFIRSYSTIGSAVLVVSYRMDPEIVQAQGAVNDSFSEYEQLKMFRHPLKTNFMLTLALFNLVSLFGAIWVAFFVAKQITGPIQRLAEGTKSVARGNYDFRLNPIRDDEMGFLVTSFNSMLSELRSSRDEAQRGSVLIETILANLAVGVIALDPDRRVTTVNSAAGSLLQIDHVNFSPGVPLGELLRSEDFDRVAPLIETLDAEVNRGLPQVSEIEMRVDCGGRELLVMCTAGRIVARENQSLGYVLLFDDITDISRSQHLAAWRDVARRIAHEIKNPLTPIQLSAQRLEKLLAGDQYSQAVQESTRTIVEHVALIKRLANEFSEYGRMPTAQFGPTDLSALLANTVANFRENNPDVFFQCEIDGKFPEMLLDPEQIRGVIINILDNAVAAVRGVCSNATSSYSPEVKVRASFDRNKKRALLEFSDNGPGVSAADKSRIFEPYFTTKKGGTGLGLAIVSSVVSDHQGDIRIFDSQPRGVKFVVTLPQHPHPSTLRRFSSV
jgi:two-component system nitrogen regulation sensor histidine kinase NtrY